MKNLMVFMPTFYKTFAKKVNICAQSMNRSSEKITGR